MKGVSQSQSVSEELVVEVVREEIARAATRVAWPLLLTARDISHILGIEESAARRRLASGGFGTCIRIGRRVHVRRRTFEASLREIERRSEGEQANT